MNRFLMTVLLLLACGNIHSQTDTLISSVLSTFKDGSIFYKINYEEKDSVHSKEQMDIYKFNYYSNTDSLFLSDYNYVPPPPMDLDFSHIISLIFLKNSPHNPVYITSNYCVESCYSINTVNSQTQLNWNIVTDDKAELFTDGLTDNVYLYTGNKLFKSTDGGNSWPDLNDTSDISFPFHPLALAPDSNFFMIGYDDNRRLVATNDFGKTVFVIDQTSSWNSNCKIVFVPGNELFYYAYNYNGPNGYNTLYRKSISSNTETLEELFSSPYPILFTLLRDSTNTLACSKNQQIVTSPDSGSSFSFFAEPSILPSQLFDFNGYLGFAYPNRLEIFLGEKKSVLKKSIEHSLNFMPLQIGHLWKYHTHSESFDITNPSVTDTYNYFKIIGDTLINGKHYYKTSSSLAFTPFEYELLRVDSSTGIVYGISPYYEGEQIALYLLPFRVALNFMETFGLINDSYFDFIDLFGQLRRRMTYSISSLFVMEQQFVENIGVTYRYSTFDFGFETLELTGAVINGALYGDTTTVQVNSNATPSLDFSLYQNYPNPFNPTTTIEYSIPYGNKMPMVKLTVYDILGREIATLVNKQQKPGNYKVNFNAENLSSGLYFYKLSAGGLTITKKMIVLK